MTLKVLHIFSPNLQTRFGGTTFRWRGNFLAWSDDQVSHYVLDTKNREILESRQAFAFKYQDKQSRLSRFGRFKWIFTLISCLKQFRPQFDILHFHVLWWGGLLAAAWAKWKRIPTIYETVLQESDTPSVIKEESFGWLKLWLLRQFTAIYAISDALAQDYLDSGFDPAQVFVLPNCLDTELFRPINQPWEKAKLREKLGLPGNSIVILFVGSMIKRKGIDLLIDSFISVSKEVENLFLWIIGPSNLSENPSLDQDFVESLLNEIDQAKLSDRVLVSGLIQHRQSLSDSYRAADLFVFPSRNEGLPNVILEAMASGLPVVVSDLPGLKSITKSGENALVIPIDNSNKLSDAIKTLINRPHVAVNFGKAAREYVVKNHSFFEWQSRLVQNYHQLIGRSLFPNR